MCAHIYEITYAYGPVRFCLFISLRLFLDFQPRVVILIYLSLDYNTQYTYSKLKKRKKKRECINVYISPAHKLSVLSSSYGTQLEARARCIGVAVSWTWWSIDDNR